MLCPLAHIAYCVLCIVYCVTAHVVDVMAISVNEYLDLLIPLVGSVGAASISLGIPAAMDILTFWPYHRKRVLYPLTLAKNLFILVFALIGAVSGTASAVIQLVGKLNSR